MKFSYYSATSRILLLLLALGPFFSMSFYLFVFGNILAKCLGVVLFFLFLVFLYKCLCMHVTIDESGVHYKSLFKNKTILWKDMHDVLIVVRQRRNSPDYYNYQEWIEHGNAVGGNFVLFRSDNSFPENPMFMFSLPVSYSYISLQCRKQVQKVIELYRVVPNKEQ